MKSTWIVFSAALLAGCGSGSGSGTETYTLYRNSPFGHSTRVHWATFNARERDPAYNMSNCFMASRLLNANLSATAERLGKKRDENLGFWCEPGEYRDEGSVPWRFHGDFPID